MNSPENAPGRISARDAMAFDLGGDAADRHDELFAQAALEDHLGSTRHETGSNSGPRSG